MDLFKKIMICLMVALPLAGCDNSNSTAEDAGESIDNAADNAQDSLEDAGDNIEDTADDMTD